MKKFFKNDLFIFVTLFFLFLLFKNNIAFKKCILNGCFLFFENVLPSLFPFFIINDFLVNYNFFYFIEKTFHKLFHKWFGFSIMASYIFCMSMVSGTPTNAYLTAQFVENKTLSSKDASVILSYSCFLNPLFLYSMLYTIFGNYSIVFKIIILQYGLNFFIAFFLRKYPYETKPILNKKTLPFSKLLPKSLKRSIDTLFLVLGTLLFYFLICEGFTSILNIPFLNCFLNGLLEVTGGLSKLILLNVNYHAKEILACFFISFGGFSIHTQIKSILEEASISYKYFFIGRIIHALLSTCLCIVIP